MRKRRQKTIAAQIKLIGIEEATTAAPKNDGLGFGRILVGGELGDEADVELRNRAERETRKPSWSNVPEEVKEAFVAIFGCVEPPREIQGRTDHAALYLAHFGPW